MPLNPIYNPDGSYYGLPASGVVIPGDLSQNVIANSNLIVSKTTTNQLVGNLALTYKFSKDFSARVFGGLDYRVINSSFFGDPRMSNYFNMGAKKPPPQPGGLFLRPPAGQIPAKNVIYADTRN